MSSDQPNRLTVLREAISRPLDLPIFEPTSSTMSVELGAVSSCGKARSHNTDHYLAIRLGRFQETVVSSLAAADLPPRFEEYAYAMLVADGMEGEGGVRASRLALSALARLAIRYGKWNVRVGPDTASEIVEQGEFLFRQVNDAVRDASQSNLRLPDMATSLTVVYMAGSDLFFAHVGHTRAFLFRNGELIQLTTDQTLEQMRLDSLTPTLLEQSRRDQKHVVTETIGGRPLSADVRIQHVQMLNDDRVILCTNGLTDVVNVDQIADVLAAHRRPAEECQRLVDLASAADAPDDVTVVVADYSLPVQPPEADTPDEE